MLKLILAQNMYIFEILSVLRIHQLQNRPIEGHSDVREDFSEDRKQFIYNTLCLIRNNTKIH